jgi:hypothetical protein
MIRGLSIVLLALCVAASAALVGRPALAEKPTSFGQDAPPALASFSSSGSVTPSDVPANSDTTVQLAATFTSSTRIADVNVDIEIRDRAGNRVFQQLFLDQAFDEGQSLDYAAIWSVPSTQPEGSYSLKTGVFSTDWMTGYGWNDSAAVITIGQASLNAFYVDCAGGDDASAGTDPNHAWATLAAVNQAQLQPGNQVLLKRDCNWSGTLNAPWQGTAAQPITIAAYGSGSSPPRITGSAARLINVSGSYEIIDGLALSATPDHFDPGCNNQAVGDRTGVYFGASAQHNTLRNTDLTSLSIGVNLSSGSTYNAVLNNTFHDVNIMFTLTPTSVNSNDDAGGQNVLIQGDYNEIANNSFSGAKACAYDYDGINGQPIVVFGGQHNTIHDNTAIGSGSNFAEVGANVGAGRRPADDNTFAFNVSVGSQFVTVHGNGDFWGPTYRTRLINNVSYTTGSGSISCGGCGPNVLQMRNNIIWADKSATLYVDAPIDEGYDIFWNRDGSPYTSVPISGTSKIADPLFVNPDAGDFHLRPGSPAIGAGTVEANALGLTVDRDGKVLVQAGPANIGVYVH